MKILPFPEPPEYDAYKEQEPMFDSIEQMCIAFGWGWDEYQQILRDMELTRPIEPGDVVH